MPELALVLWAAYFGVVLGLRVRAFIDGAPDAAGLPSGARASARLRG